MGRTAALLPLLSLLPACASSGWTAPLETHGSMRAVMREGRTEGRVELRDAVERHSFGLGALAGLQGEIAVLDGEIWIGRPRGAEVDSGAGASRDEQATLLALTEVRAWPSSVRRSAWGSSAPGRSSSRATSSRSRPTC